MAVGAHDRAPLRVPRLDAPTARWHRQRPLIPLVVTSGWLSTCVNPDRRGDAGERGERRGRIGRDARRGAGA